MRLRLRKTVLLPQPDGPIKPVILPFWIGTSLSRTARKEPYMIFLTLQSMASSALLCMGTARGRSATTA
jgi:hypothetical protein